MMRDWFRFEYNGQTFRVWWYLTYEGDCLLEKIVGGRGENAYCDTDDNGYRFRRSSLKGEQRAAWLAMANSAALHNTLKAELQGWAERFKTAVFRMGDAP